MKQGVAEWFRLQIKEKAWKGLKEHSLAGWNIGPVPYGYLADKVPHPVPAKRAEGRTKTRLIEDPQRGPAVTQIYAWRAAGKLGVPTITARLNADHAAYAPPDGTAGWLETSVAAILKNPKYKLEAPPTPVTAPPRRCAPASAPASPTSTASAPS